jgi:2Fe-2S ferredoxin
MMLAGGRIRHCGLLLAAAVGEGSTVFAVPPSSRPSSRAFATTRCSEAASASKTRRRFFCAASSSASGNRGKDLEDAQDEDESLLLAYLRSFPQDEIPSHVHGGILNAVRSAFGRSYVHLSDLQLLGRDGLRDLAIAVEREEQERAQEVRRHNRRRPFVKLCVDIPHHSTSFDGIKWRLGESLLDVSKNYPEELGEYMEGTCGGQMSCCTCHLYLPPSFAGRLETIGLGVSEAEQDMLDLAYDPLPDRSRLGCQVILTESVLKEVLAEEKAAAGSSSSPRSEEGQEGGGGGDGDGDGDSHWSPLIITIPSGVNNVWK